MSNPPEVITAGESCELVHTEAGSVPAARSASRLLADHTTLRVGGPARRLMVARTEEELVSQVRDADAAGEPVLVLGEGSNIVVSDAGFDGTVVIVGTRGVSADVSDCAGAFVTVAAGEPWDPFVAYAVAQEWVGLEALSGIPGLVGATPIQNVGAYGADVSQTIAQVRTWDRETNAQRTFFPGDCGFGYRTSVFKTHPGRHVVLSVTFQFELGNQSVPVRYAELARALGIAVGERADTAKVREAVMALRRGKGMVLDAADHDTWSAGSFFTNPVVSAEAAAGLPVGAPRYPQPDGTVKTSAAWLIERAGFTKGYGSSVARLSSKHTLAITNAGGATAQDVVELAREIRAGVENRFGAHLIPEPVLLGLQL